MHIFSFCNRKFGKDFPAQIFNLADSLLKYKIRPVKIQILAGVHSLKKLYHHLVPKTWSLIRALQVSIK